MRRFPSVGLILLLLIGMVGWFLAILFRFVYDFSHQILLWLLPDQWVFSGLEIIFLIFILYFLDRVLRSKFLGKRIDKLLYCIPIIKSVWRIVRNLQEMIENLKVLPRIEVEWPSAGCYVRGWLRQIRWAEEKDENGEVVRKFIECTCILPSMSNPTSGYGARIEVEKVKHELENSSMDLLLHIISFTIYNPKWVYRKFNPNKYLEREFLSQENIPNVGC